MVLYKYYTLERPPGPGAIPSWGLVDTESYDEKWDGCMGGMVRA
nr:MAG TPA: Defence against restriction A C-terminal [Caudoviricetes sp.]